MEMTGGCDLQPERRGDISTDDDSNSLLNDHSYSQHGGLAEFMEQAPNSQQSVKIPNSTLYKRNGWGETYLHRACKRGDLQTVRALIKAGISVNMEDNAGWTALHEAALVGNEAVVRELLRAGANPNARSCDGVTPLHDAVTKGHYEIVRLLLQSGSNTCDWTVGGLSALDMAEEENMKQLLLTCRDSLVIHEEPQEASGQHTQPGCKSSEAQCHKQLRSQRNFNPNVRSKESGDGDGAREPADIQQREKHTNTQNLSHSESVMAILEQVWEKQTEISTWPLSAPQDAGRYHSALKQIENQLIELLNKQTFKKDHLGQKQRRVSDSLWQHVLKTQLAPLASCQRKLIQTLQRQIHLVKVYEIRKAKLSTQPPNHHSAEERQQTDQLNLALSFASSEAEDCQIYEEVIQSSVLESATFEPPALHQTQLMNTSKHTKVPKNKRDTRQSSAPQTRHKLRQTNSRMKRKDSLLHMRAEDGSRHLSELMQKGVLEPGCALHICIKACLHCAHVLADGSLKDFKGRVHPSPERWLESLFGNYIPVSSAYAWDKVMLRGESLSSYALNLESEANSHSHKNHKCSSSSSAPEDQNSEEAGLKRLMRVRTIHLVEDEELMPNALMDRCWEKLLQDECPDSQWT
ncbi:ankyrin repeat domain-containing protein 31-like isoform X1 [Xyrichtys novacula]|uniref:Ankyrin repeat domain-containing protein 31-like isoform X1 n=1 Tax=Xyrichtys novacula TaxID=13765 RepID=A0AAV1G7T3_XYRNO|nr:ankyrin repeat domain-containing protein 31-like isoform X1 [Xyrichtys novacula]